MRERFTAVMAAVAMLAVFAAVGWGQAAAQPKPLVNADIVKMVKAGLGDETIVLAIQNKPSAFETGPEELIRLKDQGVTPMVLNAMLNAAQPAPAAPAPPEPPPPQQEPGPQAQSEPAMEGVLVGFYGTCRKGDLVVFKPTIYANQVELARLACNTYFYSVARPGTYKFCATKGKCTTAALGSKGPYYFRILPTTMSYSIGQVDASLAQEELQRHSVTALDLGRVLAPKMVTTSAENPPPAFLSPQ